MNVDVFDDWQQNNYRHQQHRNTERQRTQPALFSWDPKCTTGDKTTFNLSLKYWCRLKLAALICLRPSECEIWCINEIVVMSHTKSFRVSAHSLRSTEGSVCLYEIIKHIYRVRRVKLSVTDRYVIDGRVKASLVKIWFLWTQPKSVC